VSVIRVSMGGVQNMFHKYLNKQTDKAVYITEGLSKELETCDGVAAISKNLLDTLSCPE